MNQTYFLDKLLQRKRVEREKLRLMSIEKVKKVLKKMSEDFSLRRSIFLEP